MTNPSKESIINITWIWYGFLPNYSTMGSLTSKHWKNQSKSETKIQDWKSISDEKTANQWTINFYREWVIRNVTMLITFLTFISFVSSSSLLISWQISCLLYFLFSLLSIKILFSYIKWLNMFDSRELVPYLNSKVPNSKQNKC